MYECEVESWSAWLVRMIVLFWLPNPIFSIREIVVLCMRESKIPYLRLRSHQELWSRSWHGWFLEQSLWFRRCSITPLYSKFISCFQGELKARWGATCFAPMKARLSWMILHSVSAVSRLLFGVPLTLTWTLALRTGQLSTDSVESLCVSFPSVGK